MKLTCAAKRDGARGSRLAQRVVYVRQGAALASSCARKLGVVAPGGGSGGSAGVTWWRVVLVLVLVVDCGTRGDAAMNGCTAVRVTRKCVFGQAGWWSRWKGCGGRVNCVWVVVLSGCAMRLFSLRRAYIEVTTPCVRGKLLYIYVSRSYYKKINGGFVRGGGFLGFPGEHNNIAAGINDFGFQSSRPSFAP